MQFNSLVFVLFALLFFAGWPVLKRRPGGRWVYLVIASFVFYGWWDWRFLFLIIFSGLIDYFAGLGIDRFPTRKKTLLVFSLVGNIGSLAVFKYLDFGVNNVNHLLAWLNVDAQIPAANLILPVGISFYTFQSMSYTIDIYRGQLKPTANVFHFFAYLSLFPQLVAGPIVRARDLLPQLQQSHPLTEADRWEGLQLIVRGLFKKVVIADALAPVVDAAFSTGSPTLSGAYWWLIVTMFAFQIYGDFSGYSDIARGLGRWMGYDFPLNFDHPYIAASFRDFWQRWHISLSSWLRDYIYLPLSRSFLRRNPSRTNIPNLILPALVTMLISGLWHSTTKYGIQVNLLLWGGLMGSLIVFENVRMLFRPAVPEKTNPFWRKLGRSVLLLVPMLIVTAPFAMDMKKTIVYYHQLASDWRLQPINFVPVIVIVFSLLLDWFQARNNDELVFLKWPGWLQTILIVSITMGTIVIMQLQSAPPVFIYP